MNGVVKPLRRGGWSGRGIIADVRHGQLFETLVGPKQFGSREAAIDWLKQVARERSLELVVESEAAEPTGYQ